jgi:hypothetical protein
MKPKLLWHFCVSLLLHLNNNNNLPFFNTLILFKIHTNNFYFSLYLVSFIFKLPQSQNTCHAFCCIQKHCFVAWMCLHVYIIQPQVNVHFFFKDWILFSTQIMCYKLRKNFMLLVFKILLLSFSSFVYFALVVIGRYVFSWWFLLLKLWVLEEFGL